MPSNQCLRHCPHAVNDLSLVHSTIYSTLSHTDQNGTVSERERLLVVLWGTRIYTKNCPNAFAELSLGVDFIEAGYLSWNGAHILGNSHNDHFSVLRSVTLVFVSSKVLYFAGPSSAFTPFHCRHHHLICATNIHQSIVNYCSVYYETSIALTAKVCAT